MYELNRLAAITYVELNMVCVALILLVWLIARSYLKQIQRKIRPLILTTGICYIVYLLADTVWVIAEYKQILDAVGLYAINIVYFVSLLAAAILWLFYVCNRLEFPCARRVWFYIVVSIPVLAVMALTVATVKTGWIFYINELIKYDRGPLFFLFPVVNYGLILLSSLLGVVTAWKSESKSARQTLCGVLALYSVPIVLAGFLHTITEVNFSCLGYAAAILYLFAYEMSSQSRSHTRLAEAQERYRTELEKKRALSVISELSEDYDSIEYIILQADKMRDTAQILRSNPLFAKLIPGWETELNFQKRLNLFIDYLCYEPDRENLREQAKRENILQVLEKKPTLTLRIRCLIEGVVTGFQMKYSGDRNEDGKLVGFIVGIRSIEDEMRRELEYRAGMEKLVDLQSAQLMEQNRTLYRTNERIVALLGDIVEGRDRESGQHIQRVKNFTRILATKCMQLMPEYGLNDYKINLFTFLSPLHDIGKIAVPDSILLKPGRLTTEEFKVMKTHCEKGVEILKRMEDNWDADYLRVATDICYCHHERWDGSGYPRGLKGREIPISAQIVSVADCYDALTTERSYKPALDPDVAFDMILHGECGSFSGKLMYCFQHCREEFTGHSTPVQDNWDDVIPEIEKEIVKNKIFNDMRVLLVDDDNLSRMICRELLEDEGAVVTEASSGSEAISILTGADWFDIVIMDIVMPGLSGIDATRQIRRMESGSPDVLPIVTLTADRTAAVVENSLVAGANACIGKPLNITELSSVLLNFVKENSANIKEQLDNTIRKANTDPLTKVQNITAYTDKIMNMAQSLHNDEAPPEFAIVVCDVNNLKQENDTYGHDAGDTYIINCSRTICSVFARSPVYRIGGDEFAVILEGFDYTNRDSLMEQLEGLIDSARKLSTAATGKADLAAGLAVYDPETDKTVTDVFKRADASMYRNKRIMKNTSSDSARN